MGAKQSKRSVDISGKEAENAGEVAAAGAGGEGRVEQLADADALKPQLNGDAHMEPAEKEKDGNETPENLKDVTTEKDVKEEENKEAAPVTNGDAEQKPENGETPSPEENKKQKKEKVKKKWSLRSISFSRKDKPKPEKKQKDEDKANGEPDKVPEEVAEVTAEIKKEVSLEANLSEGKEDKTPETPVTEPITNGSSTPESPKSENPTITPVETKADKSGSEEPEKLPVNGFSLKKEVPESLTNEPNKSDEISVEPSVPVSEIPVKYEVCVEQMPLIEPTPPPLPATSPPSSVASFAATTMAPELTNASLANSADVVTDSSSLIETNTDTTSKNEIIDDAQFPNSFAKDEVIVETVTAANAFETKIEQDFSPSEELNKESESSAIAITPISNKPEIIDVHGEPVVESLEIEKVSDALNNDSLKESDDSPLLKANENKNEETSIIDIKEKEYSENCILVLNSESNDVKNDDDGIEIENLKNKSKDSQINSIKTNECTEKEEAILTNGDSAIDDNVDSPKLAPTSDDSLPPSLSEVVETLPPCGEDEVSNDASESFPLPPSELCPSESEISQPGTPERNGEAPSNTTQEPFVTPEKIADLIPEVPVITGLNTELETTTDVAVAN